MITVDAVYTQGVLKPSRQLDLAEGAKVELYITATSDQLDEAADNFASLAGIWGRLSDRSVERMDTALIYTRQQIAGKLGHLAHHLRDRAGDPDEELSG